MLRTMLKAAAGAGVIAIGAIALAAPAAASPHGSVSISIGTPGFWIGFGDRPSYRPRPYWSCEPTYGWKPVTYHGNTSWQWVKIGQDCDWVYPGRYPHGPYRPF